MFLVMATEQLIHNTTSLVEHLEYDFLMPLSVNWVTLKLHN
jgi:hypothetical protein